MTDADASCAANEIRQRASHFAPWGAFLVATLLPAGAGGWLDSTFVAQDRALERQRVHDRLESVASSLTATIEREQGPRATISSHFAWPRWLPLTHVASPAATADNRTA
jgi:hypothetical protein